MNSVLLEISEKKRSFYSEKWSKFKKDLDLEGLEQIELKWIESNFIQYGLSFQQAKKLTEMAQRLSIWDEKGLSLWKVDTQPQNFWSSLMALWDEMVREGPDYSDLKQKTNSIGEVTLKEVEKKGDLLKRCPAYSDEHICCGLNVINIIENCVMECSYCILQSFYDDREVRITKNLKERLAAISIDPNKLYRIGTGEYSDSLALGNVHGILDDLLDFALAHKNVCLEFKTKSTNTRWLIENSKKIPANLIATWSLNSETIADHEEHKTPSVDKRLEAARKVADAGILVGFHFHPMIRYRGCGKEYSELAKKVRAMFSSKEVIFVSQGSLSFIKQHQSKLMKNFPNSKLLRSELLQREDNKIGYTKEVRISLYQLMNLAFSDWDGQVFRYLCMEGPEIYKEVLGFTWENSAACTRAMDEAVFEKIQAHSRA